MSRFRFIQTEDNAELAKVIRAVLTEVGANKEGFAFADPYLDNLYQYYDNQKGWYKVVLNDKGRIVGGAGMGELTGEKEVLELQKMYFLPEARGKGLAATLLQDLLNEARSKGYKGCYIETVTHLKHAIKLYKQHGFVVIANPMGNTGHFGCNVFLYKTL